MSFTDQPDFCTPTLGPISKESRWEWNSTCYNDSEITDGTVPDNFLTGVAYKGKFFPRGCRGKIEQIELYCRRTGAGTVTLAFSPQPCMGEVGTVVITPSATWAWQSQVFRRFWNYDSLFIWIKAIGADVSYAYDEEAPQDAHTSDAAIALWQRELRRYFIRAVYNAETSGDVPVSGTINTIELPTNVAAGASGNVTVPNLTLTFLLALYGIGRLLRLHVYSNSVSLTQYLYIYVDGVYIDSFVNGLEHTVPLNEYPTKVLVDAANTRTHWVVNIPYPFKRSIALYAYQGSGGNVTFRVERMVCEVLG